MDSKSLLDYFSTFFRDNEERGGLPISAFALTPAYGDAVTNSFVLCVSSPTLSGRGCDDKTDAIINLLYTVADPEYRSVIDRVRVYNSIDELRQHSQSNFAPRPNLYCEMYVPDEEVKDYASC